MHPAEIQAALKIRGYSQSDVARDCGIERTTVGAVVNGRSRSQRVEARIAAITGIPLEKLWPQWHGDPAHRDLILTDGERRLIERYRGMTNSQRAAVDGAIDQVLSGAGVGQVGAGSVVASAPGAIAAGRSVIQNTPPERRKKDT